jgi:probable rRNA maturation factor
MTKPPKRSYRIRVEVQVDPAYESHVATLSLERAVRATLAQQGVSGPAEVTVVVTGDDQVRRLNLTFRGVDAPTDVLSFAPQTTRDSGSEAGEGFVSPPEIPQYLGDVILSYPRAEAQAAEAGHPAEAELQLLTVHGVLHLLGHDHAEPEEKAAMWAAQEEVLRGLGVVPPSSSPPNRRGG